MSTNTVLLSFYLDDLSVIKKRGHLYFKRPASIQAQFFATWDEIRVRYCIVRNEDFFTHHLPCPGGHCIGKTQSRESGHMGPATSSVACFLICITVGKKRLFLESPLILKVYSFIFLMLNIIHYEKFNDLTTTNDTLYFRIKG